jgi:hypothetical protein
MSTTRQFTPAMFEETVAYINNEAAAIESHLFNPKTAIIL